MILGFEERWAREHGRSPRGEGRSCDPPTVNVENRVRPIDCFRGTPPAPPVWANRSRSFRASWILV